ncbi:hypothetical protein [Hyperthermus butylicus]|nr:hypothetical protein [Hyperthermus butylicus]
MQAYSKLWVTTLPVIVVTNALDEDTRACRLGYVSTSHLDVVRMLE